MRGFSSTAHVNAIVGNLKQVAKLSPTKKTSQAMLTTSAQRVVESDKASCASKYSTPIRKAETNDDASSNCSSPSRKYSQTAANKFSMKSCFMPRQSFFSLTDTRSSENAMPTNLFSTHTAVSELNKQVFTQARTMATAVTFQEAQDEQSKLQQQVSKNMKAMESHFELKPARQRFQPESISSASEDAADSPQENSRHYNIRNSSFSRRDDVMQSAPEKLSMTSWGSDVDIQGNSGIWRPSWSSLKDPSDLSSSDAETAYKVCFVRHGQSIWNKAGKFSGWVDVPLNDTGRDEARKAGQMLLDQGYFFEKAFTSRLDRATETLALILEEMQLQDQIETVKSWRINERHYGALQGLCKAETADLYGKDQVKKWRQSYHNPPPFIEYESELHPRFDDLYKDLSEKEHKQMPLGESLKMVRERVTPYWQNSIIPQVEDLGSNPSVLFVAHEHVLRGMVQTLTGIDNTQILDLRIPNALPFIFEFDEHWRPLKNYYITDESTPVVQSNVKESSETRFSTS